MKKPWSKPMITVFGDITMTEQRILTGNWPKNGCFRWADIPGAPSIIKDCGTNDAVNNATGAAHIFGAFGS